MILPVSLRVSGPEDEGFMRSVYAGTRDDELRIVNWTEEQKQAFVQMQFDAQRQHYLIHYPQAEYYVIEKEGKPIGRMIVDRSKSIIFLIDIALLPEYRNAGIGTTLMKDLMAEVEKKNGALRLHVETFNPVMKLYERLGFVKSGELGVYHEMIWRPKAYEHA
jgi:GNAT superfamily N-acetyltransferase